MIILSIRIYDNALKLTIKILMKITNSWYEYFNFEKSYDKWKAQNQPDVDFNSLAQYIKEQKLATSIMEVSFQLETNFLFLSLIIVNVFKDPNIIPSNII